MPLNEKLMELEETVTKAAQEITRLNAGIKAYDEAITDMRRDIKCLIQHTQTTQDSKARAMIMAWNEALMIINRHTPKEGL